MLTPAYYISLCFCFIVRVLLKGYSPLFTPKWAYELGQASETKVSVPLHGCEHFYLLTKPLQVPLQAANTPGQTHYTHLWGLGDPHVSHSTHKHTSYTTILSLYLYSCW